MSQSFVHLRLHTEYSLIDGLVRLKPLISTVSEMKMPPDALPLLECVEISLLIKRVEITFM